jgi:hypothetical protein
MAITFRPAHDTSQAHIQVDTADSNKADISMPELFDSAKLFAQIREGHADRASLNYLATELEKLRSAIEPQAHTPEQRSSVGLLREAQKAASAGDGRKALTRLSGVGKWVLDTATKIGVSIAAEAIERSTGLK